jgi:hypothetical protein
MASNKGSRISGSPKKFDPYISTTDDRLQAIEPISGQPYWQLFGFSNNNASDWNAKRQFWDAPTTGLFALYSNAVTSTSIVKKKVKHFIEDFRAFANPLLNIIAASPNATPDDENIFNLVLGVNRKKASHAHTKIADKCITGLITGKGGNMRAESRSDHDSKRASLAEGADSVQYAYMIMDENPKTISARISAVERANAAGTAARLATPTLLPFIPTPLPVPVPQHAHDGTQQEFYSGATHEFSFGDENEGKYLCLWTRWFNSKHPELAGDWSEMQTVLIG